MPEAETFELVCQCRIRATQRGEIHLAEVRFHFVGGQRNQLRPERAVHRAAIEVRLGAGKFEPAAVNRRVGSQPSKHHRTEVELLDFKNSPPAQSQGHNLRTGGRPQKREYPLKQASAALRIQRAIEIGRAEAVAAKGVLPVDRGIGPIERARPARAERLRRGEQNVSPLCSVFHARSNRADRFVQEWRAQGNSRGFDEPAGSRGKPRSVRRPRRLWQLGSTASEDRSVRGR